MENSNLPSSEKPWLIQLALPIAILAGSLLIAGALFMTRSAGLPSRGSDTPTAVKVKGDDHILGNKKATVTMVEFADFQCLFCRRFWSESFPLIKQNYIDTGKILFVFKNLPLTDIHSSAMIASEAAECANEQGKFWEMHDKIFSEQQKQGTGTIAFSTGDLKRWAGDIGLNTNSFNQCFDSKKYDKFINDSAAYGSSLGISGTPTFFVNGQKIVGAQPYVTFQAALDAALR